MKYLVYKLKRAMSRPHHGCKQKPHALYQEAKCYLIECECGCGTLFYENDIFTCENGHKVDIQIPRS